MQERVVTSDTDKELAALLIKAQAGDQTAYEKFLAEIAVILRCFLTKKIASPEVVEDILQDTLVAIHKGRHSYVKNRPLGPWIYAICNHRLVDHLRKQRRRERLEQALRTEASSISFLQSESMVDRIIELFRALPLRQRFIIEQLKLHGLTVREVAHRLNMSESAVKVTAFRGYEVIRKQLGVK